jgi:GT2 family glycosyltransferase
MTMDLTISIVSHNTAVRLRECLASIYKEASGLDLEVIVVDNHSSDDTDIMVYREFPRARLILNDKNVGFARANNQAIQAGRGRYVFVTNPDVMVQPGSLERMIRFMDETPDAGIAGCKLVYPDNTLQLSCRTFPTLATFLLRGTPIGSLWPRNALLARYLLTGWNHDSVREVDWCLGSCLLVRRRAIDDIGLMDDRYFLYYEDVDWCFRAKRRGWKVYYLSDVHMVHFYRRESAALLPNRLTLHHVKSALSFFLKFLPDRGLATFF